MNNNNETFDLDSAIELAEPIAGFMNYLSFSVSEKVIKGMPNFETGKIETLCKQIILSQASFARQLETLSNNQELLDNAIKTNVRLSEQNFKDNIVMPIVRSLLPVTDLVTGTESKIADFRTNARTTAQSNLLAIKSQLEQFLATYGIRAYQHKAEESYDPKLMRAVRTIQTSEESLDTLIAEPLQCGFMMNDEVIRFETVSLYKYI